MSQIEIPQYVDDPPHFLFWQADEIAPIGIGLVFGMFTGYAAVCTLLGLLMTRWYRKYRDDHPDGYIVHMMYWFVGLSGASKSKTIPNPFIREFH